MCVPSVIHPGKVIKTNVKTRIRSLQEIPGVMRTATIKLVDALSYNIVIQILFLRSPIPAVRCT